MEATGHPIILVVGPHRSGTSFLTQIISILGGDLGKTLMLPSHDNPRGFWENQKIVDMHDRLLQDFEKDWTTAPALPNGFENSQFATDAITDLKDILETDFRRDYVSLIKDPRICATYPLWKRFSTETRRPLKVVALVRSPQAVSQSIQVRNYIPDNDSDVIALSYLNAMHKQLGNDIAGCLVYEELIKLNGSKIMKVLAQATGLSVDTSNKNLVSQIDRLIINDIEKSYKDSELHRAYLEMISNTSLLSQRKLRLFLQEAIAKDVKRSFERVASKPSLAVTDSIITSVPQGRLNKLLSQERKVKTLKESLDAQSLKAEKELQVSRAREADAVSKIEISNQIVSRLQADNDNLAGGIAERDTVIAKTKEAMAKVRSDFDNAVMDAREQKDALKTEIDNLAGGIAERDTVIAKTKEAMAKVRSDFDNAVMDAREQKDALKTEIGRTSMELSQVQKLLSESRGERENIERNLREVERLKNAQETKTNLETLRNSMVEGQLNRRIADLENRLAYFEKAPFKAGMKKATFSTLRTVRKVLPLPETVKLGMARKMTGLAQRLQPPNQSAFITTDEFLPEDTAINFAFPETENPVISIIVPVYNEISQTVACLESIYQQAVSVDYEVILADDCSTDPLHKILKKIKGLRYYRNEKNLQFLENCNHNSGYARGDYIVFLNNDTLVKPGWLQSLYQTFFEHGDVGVVGSKLLFPTGELQEAGGIIWEDASGWNWGRGQDPNHPLYNFVRDVDYVSGASFMIKTDLFREIGGFSSGLEKAYYEDTDCCFRVRELGYRVLYQPLSEVIHIEGLSSGTDLSSGMKRYQEINKNTFYETWKHRLATHLPNAQTPEIASDRSVHGHVLYVDAVTPEPDKDSGSVDSVNTMAILRNLGYRVHFVPGTNFAHWGKSTHDLQKMGVECIFHPYYSNMDMLLNERGNCFDYVVLSRAEVCDLFLKKIRKKCPDAKIIYNTVDMHFLRMEREAKQNKDSDMALAASAMKKKELGFIKNADATIVLSEYERGFLNKIQSIAPKLWTIPLVRNEQVRRANFDSSSDILFIGGYKHPPNVDAVDWLVKKIWPKIREALPGVNLIICGSHMPDNFSQYESSDVILKGYIEDLDGFVAQRRLTIAPLRFGAGLKGKVASSIGIGVPCLGTSIAFEGMAEEGLDDIKFKATTPLQFSRMARSLYTDKKKWEAASFAGVEYHNKNYGRKNIAKIYSAMLNDIA